MTTARQIISDALTFGLNRLSPGETLDADLGDVCLSALNNVADELNGVKSFLFREILTVSGTISTATATLGTSWAGISAGDKILGMTVREGTDLDIPLDPLTMAQYQGIAVKTTTGTPALYAHDGQATVYLYPVPTGHVLTIRTAQVVSDFADLDTDYTMPKGYRSSLAALLAERMAPSLGAVSPMVLAMAKGARIKLGAQAMRPAIVGGATGVSHVAQIERGF